MCMLVCMHMHAVMPERGRHASRVVVVVMVVMVVVVVVVVVLVLCQGSSPHLTGSCNSFDNTATNERLLSATDGLNQPSTAMV